MASAVQSDGLLAFNNAVDVINAHYAKVMLHYNSDRHYSLYKEDLKALFRAIDLLEGMVRTAVSSESIEEAIHMKKMYASIASVRRALVLRNVTREEEWAHAEESAEKEDVRRRLVWAHASDSYKASLGNLSEENAPEDGRDSMPTVNFDTGAVEGD